VHPQTVTSAAPSVVPARPAAHLDPAVNELIEKSRGSVSRRLGGRGLASALLLGAAFLATAVALAASIHSSRTLDATTAMLLVLAYAGLSRVEFEVRTGLAIPTQLVLVPMLFLVPLGAVPLLVCAGGLLSRLVDVAVEHVPADRLLLAPVYSWHVVGPVAVLALHGERPPQLGDWPWYVPALLAQFAFDFAFSGGREWFAKGVTPTSQLPFMGWAFLVDSALAPLGLLAALAAVDNRAAVVLVLPLVGLLAVFARERQVRIDHALELSHAYRGTALLLGDVVEADDAYTGSHSRDVVALVRDVCERLGLDPRDRRDAEFAALLHDVGKIRIPPEIIRKPAALTPEERALIETHTVEGERLLAQVGGILANVGRIVRSCHEDWDGTGYPDRLRGEEIPLVARIIRCCDAFSAMTTDRPYRRARPVGDAVAELRRCAGTDFDPTVVEALVAAVAGG
jgi:HD-GYP domain-containing protein (c-di-GMP phosphodiesterase class II)